MSQSRSNMHPRIGIMAGICLILMMQNLFIESVGGQCLHGGVLSSDHKDFKFQSCNCTDDATYNGPNCEVLKRTFDDIKQDDTIVFIPDQKFPNLLEPNYLHISIEIIQNADVTKQNRAILFWNDISLYTSSEGLVHLCLNISANGSCNIDPIVLSGKEKNAINNNKWRRIDLFLRPNDITIMLDRCGEAGNDIDNCYQVSNLTTPIIINGNDPLYVGSRSKKLNNTATQPANYLGCVKNLRINGKLIDLFDDKNLNSSGCHGEAESCDITPDNRYGKCGRFAECVAPQAKTVQSSCFCKPGKRNSNLNAICSTDTQAITFSSSTKLLWELSRKFENTHFNTRKYSIQMLFRTVNLEGQLIRIPFVPKDSSDYQYLNLKISSGIVWGLLYHNDTQKIIEASLPLVSVNDGLWHKINLILSLNTLEIILDDGASGPYYNFTIIPLLKEFAIIFPAEGAITAGKDTNTNDTNFEGCINDVRINTILMPLTTTTQDVTLISNGISGCNSSLLCATENSCGLNDLYTCEDTRWGMNRKCICNESYSVTEASPPPCYKTNCEIRNITCANNGTCIKISNSMEEFNNTINETCSCLEGYEGTFCQKLIVAPSRGGGDDLEWYWILLILFLLLLLLLFLLLLIFCCCCAGGAFVGDSDGKNIHNEYPKENLGYYNDSAGETDFSGYIDYKLLINALKPEDKGILPDDHRPRSPNKSVDKPITGGPNDKLPWENPHLFVQKAPYSDSTLEYAYEGNNLERPTSLSTLPSRGESDQVDDFNHIQNWGPKFERLSNLYN